MASEGSSLAHLQRGCYLAASPVLAAGRSFGQSVRGYRMDLFRGDLVSGLTVALVAIPQSMAFALIAGVPPIYGVYTAIVAAIVGTFFTSSQVLAIGPTNTASLLILSGMAAFSPSDDAHRIELAVMLTLFAGLIQIAFALGRMGELVRYVSHSVIVGFSAGAGVLIAVGQVPAFLGISLADTTSRYEGVGRSIERLTQAIGLHGQLPQWQPIAVGLLSIAVLLVCRRVSRWLPGYLLAVVAGGLVVYFAGWGDEQLRLVGDLPVGLPPFDPPPLDWHAYRPLLAPAFAIAMVGMIENCGIGKVLAGKTGEKIVPNQQFLCIGIVNAVTSWFQGIASSGSYSRSALAQAAGARTRFAGLFCGVFVAVLFLLLAPLTRYIPMASIAAILFVIAYNLVDLSYFKKVAKSNPADLAVCLGTFAATLTVALEIAVFVGIFLTLALYLQRARQLYITEMVRTPGVPSGFIERPLHLDQAPASTDHEQGPIVFLQVEGNLFFAAADDLQDRFNDLLARKVRAVVLRLKRTHMVDATIMHVIEQFARQLREEGHDLILCGVRPRMYDRMQAYGLVNQIGQDNIFVANDEPFRAAKLALERARHLVGEEDTPPPDDEPTIPQGNRPEPVT